MRLSNLNIKKINTSNISDILFKLGELYQFESGIYGYGNLWTKLERTIENIIIDELDKAGCVQVEFPQLQPKNVWVESGRWETYTDTSDIMFTLENNLGEYGLAPTAEECALVFASNRLSSYKNLPAVYYQINAKFRKEMRTRGYLFRSRAFVMMDAYSFDKDESDMEKTFEMIKDVYFKIFKRLGIKIIPTVSDNGVIGGSKSLEFQAETKLGEDKILYYEDNNIGINKEVLEFDNKDEYLEQLGIKDVSKLKEINTVELGHIFALGDKYSSSMELYFKDRDGNDSPYYMGCYGIGISRIIAMIIENNVIIDNGKVKGFVLPYSLAPYKVQIIYNENNKDVAEKLYCYLNDNGVSSIIDDREDLTIGNRINDVYVLGTPKMIVLGNKFDGDNFEIEDTNTGVKEIVKLDEILSLFN